jgi:Flp pilus assembly pilin Flp
LRKLLSLWRKKDGASAVEYALMIGLIALAISVAVNTVGKNLSNTFTNGAQAFETQAGAGTAAGTGAGTGRETGAGTGRGTGTGTGRETGTGNGRGTGTGNGRGTGTGNGRETGTGNGRGSR